MVREVKTAHLNPIKPGFEMNTIVPHTRLVDAQNLFKRGTDCLGYAEIVDALGIKWNDVPIIPFTLEELTHARSLGQFLILYIDKTKEEKPLTMEALRNECHNTLEEGKLLYDTDWYEKNSQQDFFLTETPTLGWKLVGKEVIPGTLGVNYLTQTEILAEYLRGQVYANQELPAPYAAAIKEFEGKQKELEKLMDKDWQKAAESLAALKLNQYFRETPVEFLYRHIVYTKTNKERLMPSTYIWTKSRSSRGSLVLLGDGDAGGVEVGYSDPRDSYSDLGLCFSRSGVPLGS